MLVPVPNVNPVAPYSTFQEVSVPPAVQDTSAEEEVIFEAVNGDVWGQVADCLIWKLSIAISLQ